MKNFYSAFAWIGSVVKTTWDNLMTFMSDAMAKVFNAGINGFNAMLTAFSAVTHIEIPTIPLLSSGASVYGDVLANADAAAAIAHMQGGLLGDKMNRWDKQIMNPGLPNTKGSGVNPEFDVNKVNQIVSPIKIDTELLSLMRDMSERSYINHIHLTSQSPEVHMHLPPTGSGDDYDGPAIVDHLVRHLSNQMTGGTGMSYGEMIPVGG
jgi:hypothetical protein